VSIHRLQVSGPDRLGALLLPRHTLAVQIEKRSEGEAKNVILGALAVHYDVKHV
jgi:3-polyprenyl-4-hydroxybenzoate decarboxylase